MDGSTKYKLGEAVDASAEDNNGFATTEDKPCKPVRPSIDEQAETPEMESSFQAQHELDAANHVIRIVRFGAVPGRVSFPFSRQLRNSCRVLFPDDCDVYNIADRNKSRAFLLYVLMRLLTLGTFVGILYFLSAVIYQYQYGAEPAGAVFLFPGWLLNLIGTPSLVEALVMALADVASLLAARSIIRHMLFFVIKDLARRTAFKLYTRHSDIVSRITEHCANSKRRVGEGAWPERAGKYTKCALWNAKRAEYLDRYSTTVGWLVSYWTTLIELVTNAASLSLLLGLTVMVATNFFGTMEAPAHQIVIGRYALLAVVWVGYGVAVMQREKSGFWTEAFRSQTADHDDDDEHYFDRIASHIEDLVDEVVSKEFGGRKEAATR
ncbi:MAG: hypothetical protein ACWA5T_04220 [Parvularcula sp.]